MTTTSSVTDLARPLTLFGRKRQRWWPAAPNQWQQTTLAENWTVAATAHHLAAVQQAFVGIVEQFAAANTYSQTWIWTMSTEATPGMPASLRRPIGTKRWRSSSRAAPK
ncbi:MAG: hypothetical protein R2849_15830 [Thermomicrobiales bacterium]